MNAVRCIVHLLTFVTFAAFTKAAQPNSIPSVSLSSSLAREVTAAHNLVRNRLGIAPLAWSGELAQVAQDWAHRLVQTGTFEHRRNLEYGENIFEIWGATPYSQPDAVVRAWASESASYRYETNTCTGRCGHYTQIIWRQTKEVGCGVARDSKREVWVCNYAPYGNIIGEKPY